MQHNLKEEKLSMKLEESIKMFIKPQFVYSALIQLEKQVLQ
jgi:hypothetical protein